MVARQQLVVGLIPTRNLMVARQQLVVGSIPTQNFKNLPIIACSVIAKYLSFQSTIGFLTLS